MTREPVWSVARELFLNPRTNLFGELILHGGTAGLVGLNITGGSASVSSGVVELT